jgi:hypothetical protein
MYQPGDNVKPMPVGLDELVALSPAQQRRLLLERMASSEADQEKFWGKAKVESTEDCWMWLGRFFNDGEGYGQIKLWAGNREKHVRHRFRAHRVAYFLSYGHLPDDLCVCHHCDNPSCVNPYHLFLGSNRKNIQDRTNKRRDAKGEQHGMHKLTTEEVLKIRHLRATRRLPYSALGEMFGVSTTHAGFIVRREAWKHLK